MGTARISISRAGRGPTESEAFAQRQLQFALGRFGDRVRSFTVRLSDLNGPKGGVDKRCLVTVRLSRPRRVVVVEEVDAKEAAVIARAVDRASRAVARAVHVALDLTRGPRRGVS